MIGVFGQYVLQCWSPCGQFFSVQNDDVMMTSMLTELGEALDCSCEAFVVAAVFLARLCQKTNLRSLFQNAFQAAIATLYVSAKMLYDECRDVDMCAHAIQYSLIELARLEQKFVAAIGWDLFVGEYEYNLYKQQLEMTWANKFFSAHPTQSIQLESPLSIQPVTNQLTCDVSEMLGIEPCDLLSFPYDVPTWDHASTFISKTSQQHQQHQHQLAAATLTTPVVAAATSDLCLPDSCSKPSCMSHSCEFSWLGGTCTQQDDTHYADEWSSMINPSSVDFAPWGNAVFSLAPPVSSIPMSL